MSVYYLEIEIYSYFLWNINTLCGGHVSPPQSDHLVCRCSPVSDVTNTNRQFASLKLEWRRFEWTAFNSTVIKVVTGLYVITCLPRKLVTIITTVTGLVLIMNLQDRLWSLYMQWYVGHTGRFVVFHRRTRLEHENCFIKHKELQTFDRGKYFFCTSNINILLGHCKGQNN
jgi:hypothetical protein